MSYGIVYFMFFYISEMMIEAYRSENKKRILFIASAGGHLTELLTLKSLFKDYNSVLITEKNYISKQLKLSIPIHYLKYCSHFYIFKYIFYTPWNIFLSIVYFIRYNPDLVYTTGAHTAVTMCYLAYLFDRKIIFVEVYDRKYTPTLSGRIIQVIADKIVVQQTPLLKKYKKAIYIEGVYE